MRLVATLLIAVLTSPAFAGEPLQPIGALAVDESEVVFARAAGQALRAHIYRPKNGTRLPAIIDVHGGAWSSGDRMSGQHYDRALASAGLFVLAIDFRQAPQFQHPSASRDVAAAVRYLRSNASTLSIESTSIGLVGSSSGGHLALLAGVTPNAQQFRGTEIANAAGFEAADAVDAHVSYVIALWPVSDPAYRYAYAQRVGRAELVKSHDSYFGSLESMQEASVPRLLRAGGAEQLPSVFVVQAGKDANIPREMTFDLLAAYQEAGGRVAYEFYPNQPHAFGHRASADTDHLIGAMRDFITAALR